MPALRARLAAHTQTPGRRAPGSRALGTALTGQPDKCKKAARLNNRSRPATAPATLGRPPKREPCPRDRAPIAKGISNASCPAVDRRPGPRRSLRKTGGRPVHLREEAHCSRLGHALQRAAVCHGRALGLAERRRGGLRASPGRLLRLADPLPPGGLERRPLQRDRALALLRARRRRVLRVRGARPRASASRSGSASSSTVRLLSTPTARWSTSPCRR
jgi:hypothetical protein